MLKKILQFVFVILLLPSLFSTQQVRAERITPEVPTQEMEIQAAPLDERAVVLRDYFAQYNSPLQDHASDFVEAADKYNLDWKLVAAISGVESTFGKETPGGYNGWGWGVYGDQAIYFSSWRDGIFQVSKGLRENYYDKGLTDPYSINTAYAASPTWGSHVEYFLNDIDRFSQKYPLVNDNKAVATNVNSKTRIALGSAQLSVSQKPIRTPSPIIALNP